MKYSGHRKLLCELSKLSKFNAFNLLGYLPNWFQCVRRVYATAMNFPCIKPLGFVILAFHLLFFIFLSIFICPKGRGGGVSFTEYLSLFVCLFLPTIYVLKEGIYVDCLNPLHHHIYEYFRYTWLSLQFPQIRHF